MKIEQVHIEKIREDFSKMHTAEHFLNLMNYVKPLIYGKKTHSFSLNQIYYYANPKPQIKRYHTFEIKKKSGANRPIHAPVNGLKSIQKVLGLILQSVFEPHKAATGFVPNKSIVDNATIHLNNTYVYNVDLKDFFSSIDQARVWKCFQLKPFNLINPEGYVNPKSIEFVLIKNENGGINVFKLSNNFLTQFKDSIGKDVVYEKEKIEQLLRKKEHLTAQESTENENFVFNLVQQDLKKNYTNRQGRSSIANIMAALCCTEMTVERMNQNGEWQLIQKNVLPQGAPTSPVITNIVCQRLDFLLSGLAKRFGLRYSRYADDITFSSMHNVYDVNGDFINELHRIINNQGFHIKESKTRLQKEGYRKEVTGLLVNDKVNVQKRYIKQLRMWLYYWEEYGYTKANQIFIQDYIADKGHIKDKNGLLLHVLDGKLNYLKMVKGMDDSTYIGLKKRFDQLAGPMNPTDKLLDVWEKEGIEKAMHLFYKDKLS
jgi:hypothetical protein